VELASELIWLREDGRISVPEWAELWPSDDSRGTGSAEYSAASNRRTLLAARLLSIVAANPQRCAERASRLLKDVS
jgi:hypothetical protein